MFASWLSFNDWCILSPPFPRCLILLKETSKKIAAIDNCWLCTGVTWWQRHTIVFYCQIMYVTKSGGFARISLVEAQLRFNTRVTQLSTNKLSQLILCRKARRLEGSVPPKSKSYPSFSLKTLKTAVHHTGLLFFYILSIFLVWVVFFVFRKLRTSLGVTTL